MILNKFLPYLFSQLYRYDWGRELKEYVRPVKHFIYGKGDVYLVAEQIAKARGLDKPVKLVFDVGADVGDKTITFLKGFPEAHIYCFEPRAEGIERLKRRTQRWKNRVRTFPFALGATNGFADMRIFSHEPASSIAPVRQFFEEVETRKIKVRRLDDVVSENRIDHIDLIKIDVEGAERDVLAGGTDTFRDKIDNVFIEISSRLYGEHSSAPADIFRFLYEAGFTFMGSYGDYFFSKDKDVIKKHFEA